MMTEVTRYPLKRAKVGQHISSWYLQSTTGIADDARLPSREGMIIEKHRALLVVGDVEKSSIYPSKQKLQVIHSGDICRGDLSDLSYIYFEVGLSQLPYRIIRVVWLASYR